MIEMNSFPADETPRRLEPTKEVLRELFLKSGNLCAYPGCNNMMMNANGDFIGQICHIEGVKGERFRASMSNEDRRAYENLLLLCYQHHVETDNEQVWTVGKLVRMKRDHEARFTNAGTIMLEAFIDRTRSANVHEVVNLGRMAHVLGWDYNAAELGESVFELNHFLLHFVKVPIETRRFLGAVVERAWRMRNSGVARYNCGEIVLTVNDFRAAHGLSLAKIRNHVSQLEAYRLGGHDELQGALDWEDAIGVASLPSGWPFWGDLVKFCDLAHEPLTAFVEGLEFRRLDEPV